MVKKICLFVASHFWFYTYIFEFCNLLPTHLKLCDFGDWNFRCNVGNHEPYIEIFAAESNIQNIFLTFSILYVMRTDSNINMGADYHYEFLYLNFSWLFCGPSSFSLIFWLFKFREKFNCAIMFIYLLFDGFASSSAVTLYCVILNIFFFYFLLNLFIKLSPFSFDNVQRTTVVYLAITLSNNCDYRTLSWSQHIQVIHLFTAFRQKDDNQNQKKEKTTDKAIMFVFQNQRFRCTVFVYFHFYSYLSI